ncbi:hypothetical protein TVAG_414140 [Trichomonas vaginalis G3]|uniref:Uncharacterized protein n=1 Tax=Trichomonas vaginalis (strain ATCC PRA-98 / G3) TaxID=412133 RepID=A2EC86_TRIV3|nr:hypothetical protein TVAGG3_0205650 [Trichomonas vaginalis G3]EAY09763.1 hypothetical protein TVAG_414140 [Trichomonas vaginalis G3]KAI5550921.1 hypothetical protein TVAGG3_0205650 [Trichomonas vaginalis G3]|eukprot:XP_001321986.1 hypothetical protein [Trichomonas vaginalis G3]
MEKDLLKYGILNVDFTERGQLILSYNGKYPSKTITVNLYKKPQEDSVNIIVFGSITISFTTKENPSENEIKIDKDKPIYLYVFFSFGGTKIQISESALNVFLTVSKLFESLSSKVTLSTENTYDEPMLIRIQSPNSDEEETFTINIENPYSTEKSYILSPNSTYKSALSSELDKYVIPLPVETKKDEDESDNSNPNLETPTKGPTNAPIISPTNDDNNIIKEKPSSNKGKTIGIAVGVVGAVLVIAAASVVGFILFKKNQKSKVSNLDENNSENDNDSENDLDL